MCSPRVKHHKNIAQIYPAAKFFLSFYNNTMCNKINQITAQRMDWYSLKSIHKSESRGIQISECLIILNHLSREIEL